MTKTRFISIIIGIVIIAIIISWLKPAAKTDTNLVKVTRGNIVEQALAVGNIIPLHSISVTSAFAGIVGKLFHDEGDAVKKGEPLLEVKPNPTPKDLDTAKRTLDDKKVTEQNASAHLKRYQTLLKQGYVTKDDYDQAVKDYQSAKVQRQLAEEQLAIMQQGKATVAGQTIQSVIVSPIDGYILSRQVDVGDSVVPQTDYQTGKTLFTIANMKDLIFEGQVNEIDVGKLHEGMPTTLTLSALPNTKITGTLSKIALESAQLDNQTNASNPNNQNSNNPNTSPFNVGFNVRINNLAIPNNTQLRAGYSANAEITIKRANSVLILPERVVEFKDDKTFVWLPGKHNKPKQHEIKIGISDGINVEVLSGLKENDEVLDNSAAAKDTDNS